MNKSRTPEQELAARTRRGFLTMGAAAAAGFGAWEWLRTRPEEDKVARPFRRMLQFNERVAETYYSESHLAPVFPASRVQEMRVNGDLGLDDDFDPGKWQLTVTSSIDPGRSRQFALADIQALPKVEHTTQLKCIEGWADVIHWAGARFSDFTARFAPEWAHTKYVGLATPDKEYYVGLDMASALHPQTLLCYEMNGAPLTLDHGAPLRLAIPVKYGIKNLKRIGTITYTDNRPGDYWTEQGYDWYAGL